MLKPYHAHLEEVPRTYQSHFGGKLSRTAFVTENALYSFSWMEGTSGEGPTDRHPFDQWLYVLEGMMEWVLGDNDVYRTEAGDVLYIPRDMPHTPRFPSLEPSLVMEVFSPIRLDYLYTAEHQFAAYGAPREPDGSRLAQQ